MRKRLLSYVLLLGLPAVAGCNWLVPFIFLGEEPMQDMPAEFNRLDGKRVLVLVWADSATLFDYPSVRFEISAYVGDRLVADMPKTTIVDRRKVEDHLQRSLLSSFDPVELGHKFKAEMVLYIELLEFQIRDPTAPDFLRGRIHATVMMYDMDSDPDDPEYYELEPVDVTHPENRPVLISHATETQIRQESYEAFAERVARKFHSYKEKL